MVKEKLVSRTTVSVWPKLPAWAVPSLDKNRFEAALE